MRTPSWVPLVYLGPAVAVMAVACLYPLLSALQLGFYDWSMGTPWEQARWVGMEAFVAAFQRPRGLALAHHHADVCRGVRDAPRCCWASRWRSRSKAICAAMAFFRTLFILPMMIAPIAVGLTWRYLFDAQFGLLNALLGLLGAGAGGLAGAGEHRLRRDHHRRHLAVDAVRLHHDDRRPVQRGQLGARGRAHRWRDLVADDAARVKLPMVMHVIAITLLMRLIDAFRVLEVIYILTFGGPGDSTEILSLHIYKTAFVGQRLGSAAAISVLLLVVVAALVVGRAASCPTR